MEKIKLKKTKRLLGGHLWVFSNELGVSPKGYTPGALVELYGPRDEFLGIGYINPNSLIAVRLLTREREGIDLDFFKQRISRALRLRERFIKGRDAYRAVYSESDGLPGLIIDKYGPDTIVSQFLTAGMEAQKDLIIGAIKEFFDPGLFVLRNDSRVRELEGLSLYKEVLKGNAEQLPIISEHGLKLEVNPLEGQKTGFFLDQAENRLAFSELVESGTGLDLFSYSGAWALELASKAARITCVDESEKALEQAKKNAALNGFEDRMEFKRGNVFDFLKEEIASKRTYDFIVLDPPAFVKSAKKIKEAVKAYSTLNTQAITLLKPGGLLATSSCSYHMHRELFIEMLREAGERAGRGLRMLALRGQAMDHPVLLSMPETEYLKCAFLLVG